MAKKRKAGISLLVLIVIVAVVVGVWAKKSLDTSRSDVADDKVQLKDLVSKDQEAIKRGEYVARLSDCAACHNENLAGGYTFPTPFGELVSSNITPDADTGIGKMTERDFFNAVRQGIGSHGPLYPAMTYTAYAKLSDQDMHDLWAYMSTRKPVHKEIHENAGLSFPYNIRLAMVGWDMLFFDNKEFIPDTSQSQEWNRGKYLVDGAGHCSACHSPRNALQGEVNSRYLQGDGAPDITPNEYTGIGKWSDQQLVDYLKTGTNGIAVASGGMAEAIEHSTQYFTDDDLKAMTIYLKTVKPSDNKAPETLSFSDGQRKKNALTYEVNCSACHGVNGEGMGGLAPAFANNPAMLQGNATNLIHAMLVGARAPHTQTVQTAAGMPSFAWKMDDQQIADVLNFVRNNWGNSAPEVKADQVGQLRHELGAEQKITYPAQPAGK